MFGAEPVAAAPTVDVTVLHAKIGELTLANDSLAGALGGPVCCRAPSKVAQRAGKRKDLGRHAAFRATGGLAFSPPLRPGHADEP